MRRGTGTLPSACLYRAQSCSAVRHIFPWLCRNTVWSHRHTSHATPNNNNNKENQHRKRGEKIDRAVRCGADVAAAEVKDKPGLGKKPHCCTGSAYLARRGVDVPRTRRRRRRRRLVGTTTGARDGRFRR